MTPAMLKQQTNEPVDSPSALRRLLVIDDERSFTRLLKINLEATGRYTVKIENDPFQAITAAIQFRPDLILLDVMMPGLDGGDVATRLASHPQVGDVPVLFLTATVRRAEVEKRHGDFGGLQFLAKPVDLPDLMDRLDGFFTNRDTDDSARAK
jgi:CheY-like chemotaxis protein